MSPETLQNTLEKAISILLGLARELTWNSIPDNCKFILSEIKNSDENFYKQRQLRKKENDKKIPVQLRDLMPELQKLYDSLFDINLRVYKVTGKMTIIDIRYYSKNSMDEEYRQTVLGNPPMLHCKIETPPWHSNKKEKFDINWEHNKVQNWWKMFWLKQKLKTKATDRN